jgi:magnesium transporter
MLAAYPKQTGTKEALHPRAVWIDLLNPTDDEERLVTETTGLKLPTRGELSEIESSSRLQRHGAVFTLSIPTTATTQQPSPVGFVLSRDHLVTIRFTALPAFEACASAIEKEQPEAGSLEIFLSLLETTVDRLADVLEREASVLEGASRRIFRNQHDAVHRPARADRELRALLREIGSAGDLISRVRETLMGVGRIGQFVAAGATDWMSGAQRPRFDTLQADIRSLVDFHQNLSDKVQFLLDATLGFINIEQNNIIKVLTIVSIVGIPPTFVASLYGMNFKDIPELTWSFGYWYALALMLVSAIAPLVWFRLSGWL